ncbi:hypothetical protein BaRGS_00035298, partial [Batillaria attramentaria]
RRYRQDIVLKTLSQQSDAYEDTNQKHSVLATDVHFLGGFCQIRHVQSEAGSCLPGETRRPFDASRRTNNESVAGAEPRRLAHRHHTCRVARTVGKPESPKMVGKPSTKVSELRTEREEVEVGRGG